MRQEPASRRTGQAPDRRDGRGLDPSPRREPAGDLPGPGGAGGGLPAAVERGGDDGARAGVPLRADGGAVPGRAARARRPGHDDARPRRAFGDPRPGRARRRRQGDLGRPGAFRRGGGRGRTSPGVVPGRRGLPAGPGEGQRPPDGRAGPGAGARAPARTPAWSPRGHRLRPRGRLPGAARTRAGDRGGAAGAGAPGRAAARCPARRRRRGSPGPRARDGPGRGAEGRGSRPAAGRTGAGAGRRS